MTLNTLIELLTYFPKDTLVSIRDKYGEEDLLENITINASIYNGKIKSITIETD